MLLKKGISSLLIFVVAAVISFVAFATPTTSNSSKTYITPVGQWWQIDEHSGKPRSIIQIYADQDNGGKLSGKILKAFPHDNKPPRTKCDLCKGDLYNAPIIGLVIMHNFRAQTTNHWAHGTILDPSSGKTYKCKLTLFNDGKTLKVRGYIGISLLGRTQVWQRKI